MQTTQETFHEWRMQCRLNPTREVLREEHFEPPLIVDYLSFKGKRKEQEIARAGAIAEDARGSKKPRFVFTDIQRRTLHAIFKETKRPSKEMQVSIQLF